MKRFSIILLGALAILMAGCSKDVEPVSPPDENAWINDVSLPVPVLFNTSDLTASTKADDPGMIDGATLSERTVGVVGINSAADSWGANYSFDEDELLLDREVMTTAEGNIVFTNPKEYYPMVSDKAYDFYGYYPCIEGKEIYLGQMSGVDGSVSGNQMILADYPIGYWDILWAGTTTAENDKVFNYIDEGSQPQEVTGYNAKYIRKVKQAEMELLNSVGGNEESLTSDQAAQLAEIRSHFPKLQFKHCLSAARFYVQAKDDYAAGTFVDGGTPILQITGLTLKDVHTTGCLIVAVKGEPASTLTEGTIIGRKPTTSLELKKKDGTTTIDPITPTTDLQELGEGLMLLPGSATKTDGGNVYYIEAEVRYTIAEHGEKTLDVKFPVMATNNFIEGKLYTFTIVFNSLEEVVIKTGLNPWDDQIDGEGNYTGGVTDGGEISEIE